MGRVPDPPPGSSDQVWADHLRWQMVSIVIGSIAVCAGIGALIALVIVLAVRGAGSGS